jgi:hypothetical protein
MRLFETLAGSYRRCVSSASRTAERSKAARARRLAAAWGAKTIS